MVQERVPSRAKFTSANLPMNNLDQSKKISELLRDAVELRGLTFERLIELSDVPERYILALRDGEFEKLPAAPYVRGYLIKIGEVLNVDGETLWQVYKNETPMKKSGPEDKLPSNRFAIKSLNKKTVAISAIILVILIYLAWWAPSLLGAPSIEIINPAVNNYITNEPTIKLIGNVNPGDKLTVNGEEVLVGASGRFEKEFQLQPGINTFALVAKRFLGKEAKIVRQIIFQPQ